MFLYQLFLNLSLRPGGTANEGEGKRPLILVSGLFGRMPQNLLERSVLLIRKAQYEDAEEIARVHISTWRSAYKGLVPDPYLNSLSLQEKKKHWQQILSENMGLSETLVALDEGARSVIGFVSVGPCQDKHPGRKGEIYALYLQDSRQKRGIGKKLFWQAAGSLERLGFSSMIVWVLKDNPARFFYEKMGGCFYAEKEEETGGKRLKELAYSWDSFAPSAVSGTQK